MNTYTRTPTDYGYSTYSLTVNSPEGEIYPDGTEVTFKVNRHLTGQTGPFIAGENYRLNLAASTTPTSGLSYLAIAAVSIMALLGAGAALYYFLPSQRGPRIIDGRRVTGNVSLEQPLPSGADGQDQVISRYIGDDAGVAGVEDTALLASESQIERGESGGEECDITGLSTAEVARQPEQDASVQLENLK